MALQPSARAQALDYAQNSIAPLPVPPSPAPPLPSVSPYAQFDPLRWKGLNIPLPGPVDTIDQRLLGVRDSLADLGIGYFGFTNSSFQDNLLHHGLPTPGSDSARNTQLYNGQLPTLYSSNILMVTYDLGRYGIPDGQIVVGGTFLRTDWNPGGPNAAVMSQATYYQTLLNGKVEFKIGYLSNSLEFLGTYVGGNIAGGVFGPSAGLPVEQGESSVVYPAPGANATVHLRPHVYDKVGVQRAISPDGTVVENIENRSGVRFAVPNSGVWVVNEVGYRRNAEPDLPQTWVRAATSYTSSRYQNLATPGVRTPTSYGLFLLADRQLVQFAPHVGTAGQGIYAGFSVEYVPPTLNRFSQYYEGRLYSFGLFPTRPRDQSSLVATYNVFSDYLVNRAHAAGQLAHSGSLAVTLSHSAHVYPGVNLNVGVSYINNPTSVTYNTHTGSALNIILGTVTFF